MYGLRKVKLKIKWPGREEKSVSKVSPLILKISLRSK
jgi:hypothetical protein